MIQVRSLTKCAFDDLLLVWNEGFQGYPMDMTTTIDNLVSRFGRDGLSAELSLVAWINGRPVGFILNGYSQVRDKKIAWNGGTGVIPQYRRTGVGHTLMEACMGVYRRTGIQAAFLESLVQNSAAISLYEQTGYRIVDEVAVMSRDGVLSKNDFLKRELQMNNYSLRRGPAASVARIPFYRAFGPWQTQWTNIHQGQSIILENNEGTPIAYALFNQRTNEAGDVTGIGLFQCESDPALSSADSVINVLLREVYGPLDYACRRTASNISYSNRHLINALESAGFAVVGKQVVMMREIGE